MSKLNQETFKGYTTKNGRTYAVTLTVDVVALIHDLGQKAAGNSGMRAAARFGSVAATVTEFQAC